MIFWIFFDWPQEFDMKWDDLYENPMKLYWTKILKSHKRPIDFFENYCKRSQLISLSVGTYVFATHQNDDICEF